VSGRWSVSRKGNMITGYNPFTVQGETFTVNVMNDFTTKRDAIAWVTEGCSIDDIERRIGITHIVWARSLSEARKVAEYPGAYLSQDSETTLLKLDREIYNAE